MRAGLSAHSSSKGFFRNHKEGEQYVKELDELAKDHSRKDLAWKYAIDADVLDDNIRTVRRAQKRESASGWDSADAAGGRRRSR